MGSDKALLPLAGAAQIARTARRVESLGPAVTLVGPPTRFAGLGWPVVDDDDRDPDGARLGPLAGLLTALRHSPLDWNLVLACDLPYLSSPWLSGLLSHAALAAPHLQAVVPIAAGRPQPLSALYRRHAAAPLETALRQGVRALRQALGSLRVEFLPEAVWSAWDPNPAVLDNMNLPADYARARLRLERRHAD